MTRTQQLPDSLILTVDDHALLREGIAALVNAEPDMKLVAEASNGKEATLQTYKLGASDRTHAVTIGLKRGIIELHTP
jgi:chemotaxis response regulator CheB